MTLPEAIVKKKDVLGAAETGSGKTLAFGIPIVNAILEARGNFISKIYVNIELKHKYVVFTCPFIILVNQGEKDRKLWALIVTPTRELTIQVKNHLSDLCKYTDIKVNISKLCVLSLHSYHLLNFRF